VLTCEAIVDAKSQIRGILVGWLRLSITDFNVLARAKAERHLGKVRSMVYSHLLIPLQRDCVHELSARSF
jgi:hypothetical protein